MSYSIKPVLYNLPDKSGLHKIQIQILYNRIKVTVPTDFKVKINQFDNGRCHGFKNYALYNSMLMDECDRVERIVLECIKRNETGKDDLRRALGNITADTFTQWIDKILAEKKFSEGRIKHYRSLSKRIANFGDFKINEVTESKAQQFEKYLWEKGLQQNTINTIMKMFKAVVNYAALNKQCQKITYSAPRYVQGIPEYLTLDEIKQFRSVVETIKDQSYRQAGLFFLLSCFTGYRISDLKRFDSSMIKDERIVIRAKKNGTVVSIPLYSDLKAIVDMIGELRLSIAEQTMREYVKDIARMAGISRPIKVHSARHSFAMMLMDKGFTVNEAGELLGDTADVAKIYARISNSRMDSVVKDKLG